MGIDESPIHKNGIRLNDTTDFFSINMKYENNHTYTYKSETQMSSESGTLTILENGNIRFSWLQYTFDGDSIIYDYIGIKY